MTSRAPAGGARAPANGVRAPAGGRALPGRARGLRGEILAPEPARALAKARYSTETAAHTPSWQTGFFISHGSQTTSPVFGGQSFFASLTSPS